MKRVIKTPGHRYYEETYPHGLWDGLHESDQATYEVKAARLEIPPIEEDVPDPPKTDAELLWQAIGGTWFEHHESKIKEDAGAVAAEFLRLRAERDGEPLEVKTSLLDQWMDEYEEMPCGSRWAFIAAKINAHRGVRPFPKVTAKMLSDAYRAGDSWRESADHINAALAKAKDGE